MEYYFLYPMLVGIAMMLPLLITRHSTKPDGPDHFFTFGLTKIGGIYLSVLVFSYTLGTYLMTIVTPIVALVELIP